MLTDKSYTNYFFIRIDLDDFGFQAYKLSVGIYLLPTPCSLFGPKLQKCNHATAEMRGNDFNVNEIVPSIFIQF